MTGNRASAAAVRFVFFSDADLEDLIADIWQRLERENIPSPSQMRVLSRRGVPSLIELKFEREDHARPISDRFRDRAPDSFRDRAPEEAAPWRVAQVQQAQPERRSGRRRFDRFVAVVGRK